MTVDARRALTLAAGLLLAAAAPGDAAPGEIRYEHGSGGHLTGWLVTDPAGEVCRFRYVYDPRGNLVHRAGPPPAGPSAFEGAASIRPEDGDGSASAHALREPGALEAAPDPAHERAPDPAEHQAGAVPRAPDSAGDGRRDGGDTPRRLPPALLAIAIYGQGPTVERSVASGTAALGPVMQWLWLAD